MSAPGRTFVDHARALAERGVASLRMDCLGIGDSPWLPEGPLGAIHHLERIADVSAAIDALRRLRFGEVSIVGVCSGGFLAFQAALADPRIARTHSCQSEFLAAADRGRTRRSAHRRLRLDVRLSFQARRRGVLAPAVFRRLSIFELPPNRARTCSRGSTRRLAKARVVSRHALRQQAAARSVDRRSAKAGAAPLRRFAAVERARSGARKTCGGNPWRRLFGARGAHGDRRGQRRRPCLRDSRRPPRIPRPSRRFSRRARPSAAEAPKRRERAA